MATTKTITVSLIESVVGFGVVVSEQSKSISMTFTPSEVVWNDGYSARIRNVVSSDGCVSNGAYDVDVEVSPADTNETLFNKSDAAILKLF